MVRANPGRIKRCNVRQARRVISLIDDPMTLAKISEHEQRVSVREAIRGNPAWSRTPHETVCAPCREEPALPLDDIDRLRAAVGPRAERIAVLGTPEICPEKVLRTLHMVDTDVQPELWKLAFTHTLGHSATAHVALAAGRIPLAPDDVPAWGARNQSLMRRLLAEEPAHTPALLDLAVNVGAIPPHWTIADDEWLRVLRTYDSGALTGEQRIPWRIITAMWESLSSRARILALNHAGTRTELETLLEKLQPDDIAEVRSKEYLARGVVILLNRFPDLASERRLGLVSMLPRREIGEYLLGRLGVLPDLDRIGDVLSVYNLGQRQASYRLLIDQAGRDESTGEHRLTRQTLIEALVRTAKPSELFSGKHRVSEAAHAYTWERLESENAVTAFAGLLEEWTGTLPDLIETAQELGR